MDYILGIDQGSTQTRAAVCDRYGNIMSYGQASGACHSVHGMDKAMQAVRLAADAATAQAGIQPEEIRAIYGGFTGADWPDEYALLEQNLRLLGIAGAVFVVNDCMVALRGGTDAGYGAIVIAGTGANCAIRSPRGEEFVYHYYHGPDLQGGVALGRRALNTIYRAATGRIPATRLAPAVLELFGMGDVDELLRADVEHRLEADRIKEIAPCLMRLAYEGDRAACEIIRSFGEGLAELVAAGLKRFAMESDEVEVVTSGNIFKGPGHLLQEVMLANIHMSAPKARLVNARYEPVVGAVLSGLEKIGVEIDAGIKANIERSSQRLRLVRVGEQG